MSKDDENNSHIIIKNNSIQNLNYYTHQKNKSSNFLTDSPSTQITAHIHSLNSNPNSKNKNSKKHNQNNSNNFVQYVNNDKFNFKGDFLNITQNYSKYILTTPNVKRNNRDNLNQIYYNQNNNIHTQKKKKSDDFNKSDKKIFFVRPIQKRRKSYDIKNSKNIIDNNDLNNILNKNIENLEELHFFYVKILQNGKSISKKFEVE